MKKFTKNDNGFVCENCGSDVRPLGYTSRDHCNSCLASKHVDMSPGDRSNDCRGLMLPVEVSPCSKGYIVTYKCLKCGRFHKNKSALDDNFDTILKVINKSYR